MRTVFVVSALAFIVPVLSAPTTVVPITKRAGPVKPGSYIIKFKDGSSQDTLWSKLVSDLLPSGSSITHDYRPLMPAFAANLKDAGLTLLQHMSEVEYIEQDSIVSLSEHGEDAINDPMFEDTHPVVAEHHSALVSRADVSGGGGSGVTVYGIDTGIYIEHSCFGGRASFGANFVDSEKDNNDDLNGHGTHTAGTAVGIDYGVATSANIIAIKVLGGNGSGATSGVVAGINWAYQHFLDSNKPPSVATMSLGGVTNEATKTAVRNAILGGLHFTVAAGNDNMLADGTSPANVQEANTIGAVDSGNKRASFSNYGKFLDLWALGVGVKSAWIGSPNAENTISGTSMATPHVAGVAAVMLSRCPKQLNSPAVLSQKLKDNAKSKVVFGTLDVVAAISTPNKGIAEVWNCSE